MTTETPAEERIAVVTSMLESIVDFYNRRSELTTSDADCAAKMKDAVQQALSWLHGDGPL